MCPEGTAAQGARSVSITMFLWVCSGMYAMAEGSDAIVLDMNLGVVTLAGQPMACCAVLLHVVTVGARVSHPCLSAACLQVIFSHC